MNLQALRQLALDTATALDAEADAQKWPEIVNGLLRQLVQGAGAKGVEAKEFYNQLELPEDEPNVVLFESTDALGNEANRRWSCRQLCRGPGHG